MGERNLLVDVYSGDLGGKPNWPAVVAAPNFVGAIIKATESVAFDTSWFKAQWPAVKAAGGDGYGSTWFRGAYHFLKFNQDGAAQADFYLDTIDAAGGFDVGDIIPIVDVELGNDGKPDEHGKVHPRNSNWDASAQQIIDCTSAFAARAKERTGQQVMLYGNGAMRDKSIKDRMGCDWLWIPRYTPTLPPEMYQRAGWDLAQVAMWQYCGDGTASLPGYPNSVDNFGKVDISVSLLPTLKDFINAVCAQVITIDQPGASTSDGQSTSGSDATVGGDSGEQSVASSDDDSASGAETDVASNDDSASESDSSSGDGSSSESADQQQSTPVPESTV